MSQFSEFQYLPTELRLEVWQTNYENNTPGRVIKVEFPDARAETCAEIQADPMPETSLWLINEESSTHLTSRFVKPFSSSLREPDYQTLEGVLSPEESSLKDIPIDLAKDTLFFGRAFWSLDPIEEIDPTVFPLHDPFRILFDEQQEMVARKLVELAVHCTIDKWFGVGVSIIPGETPPRLHRDTRILKSHLPRLEELVIHCDCHCMSGELCDWLVRFDESEEEQMAQAQRNGISLRFEHCCAFHRG